MMDQHNTDTDGSDMSTPAGMQYFPDSKTTLKTDYVIEKMLGDGAFSEVYRAKRKSDNEDVAIKIIKKSKVSQADLEREVEIWQLASKSCSRVVQLYEIYEDVEIVYLVMELMVGGELFEKIATMTDYSEAYAAKIMKQVFLIIRDLHKVHIIHQDLKPENLLLMGDSMILKLCDFGLAEIADDNTELFGCVGSTTYMAPEVTNESGHHKPVDVYAAGVIMYIMLCGYPPFEPENGIIDLEFPEREWGDISPDAKDLITQLLDEDPLRRPTPEEVLRHRWFSNVDTIRNPKLLIKTINTLKKFQELGPNGTMKEYRGDTSNKNRTTVIGLFEDPNTVSKPEEKLAEKKGGHFQITPANGGAAPPKKNESVKKPNTSSVPQLPSVPPSSSPKKKGAKTERSIDNQPSASITVTNTSSTHKKVDSNNVKDKEKEKEKEPKDEKKKKKQNDKKKRQSAPAVEGFKSLMGDFLYDPMSRYTKLEESSKDVEDKKKSKKKKKRQDSTLLDRDSLPLTGNAVIDDIIQAFHRELLYQNDVLEQLKQENGALKAKINEETETRHQLIEKLSGDIHSVRKEADEERKERRLLQSWVDNQTSSLPPNSSVLPSNVSSTSKDKAGSPAVKNDPKALGGSKKPKKKGTTTTTTTTTTNKGQ